MTERSSLIDWLRGELVGPSRPITPPGEIEFHGTDFSDPIPLRAGSMVWRPIPEGGVEEVLYYQREMPHRKYGAGMLHPGDALQPVPPEQVAAEATDTLGVESDSTSIQEFPGDEEAASEEHDEHSDLADNSDDFEVTSSDVRHPSTIGVSFCVRLPAEALLIIGLPVKKRFPWQDDASQDFSVNGRYERCTRHWTDATGRSFDAPMWRRLPALPPHTTEQVLGSQLIPGQVIRRDVPMPEGSSLRLRVEVFPRRIDTQPDLWLLTVVLRNSTQPLATLEPREATLYQTFFEVAVDGGALVRYPESQRPFEQLDPEEQSLSLLYRESATWGIGHGCAAGWDAGPGEIPQLVYADVMPSVETPSMTPDIKDQQGIPIQLSMRALAALPNDGKGAAWDSLNNVAAEYKRWIKQRRTEIDDLSAQLKPVAGRHLDGAELCLERIEKGIEALRTDSIVRTAFRLANLSMLLQQIGTKQLKRRPLQWNNTTYVVRPEGKYTTPWDTFAQHLESKSLGAWRAFQIAFLLMSIPGVSSDASADREVVDLIWFPTGGGKTEAYLGVMAFYMFHQRLLIEGSPGGPLRDGTNVLMRYTLRMLTTQQFQRAAALVCAMEFLRRNPTLHGMGPAPGKRFSLGLWIGGSGSPNKIKQAKEELGTYRSDRVSGNPLVLTECPWCRSEIGRYDGPRPKSVPQNQWKSVRVRGISDHPTEGPLLLCPDASCTFGSEDWHDWLPIEVIDERIYRHPPSLVIGTADKFAMIAFRPKAGSLFGRGFTGGVPQQTHEPPGLIIQDELHLISGPLGTMYGLYEGVFERLCSRYSGDRWLKPKLIASTATIRGAADQIKSLYARTSTQLFPSPGLLMGDSFFGTYARDADQKLKPGRLYLGIHANDYGSVLTTQVRVFSSALFRPYSFQADKRDPWWSLLTFYNSIRELGGAKTLFDSDIRSRLKFIFNRENFTHNDRRTLRVVEELTSRLSQPEIVGMMAKLSAVYSEHDNKAIDACLASSIIEVGVDIDRLSLMGIVGQPKTTAQYIQVSGRVGRRWWERPGLILTVYNPSKSRDRSHFEQFHSYHRRLYERVEPTSATPFALSAIQRALPGALIAWSRQHSEAPVQSYTDYEGPMDNGYALLRERCQTVELTEHQARALQEMERVYQDVLTKWGQNPQKWEDFPPSVNGEYLILWPGQFATLVQKQRGVVVPSSMRQVDGSAELGITQAYGAIAT